MFQGASWQGFVESGLSPFAASAILVIDGTFGYITHDKNVHIGYYSSP